MPAAQQLSWLVWCPTKQPYHHHVPCVCLWNKTNSQRVSMKSLFRKKNTLWMFYFAVCWIGVINSPSGKNILDGGSCWAVIVKVDLQSESVGAPVVTYAYVPWGSGSGAWSPDAWFSSSTAPCARGGLGLGTSGPIIGALGAVVPVAAPEEHNKTRISIHNPKAANPASPPHLKPPLL